MNERSGGAADRADGRVHTAIEGYMMGFSKRSFQTSDNGGHAR
jgi:hypothetical protein